MRRESATAVGQPLPLLHDSSTVGAHGRRLHGRGCGWARGRATSSPTTRRGGHRCHAGGAAGRTSRGRGDARCCQTGAPLHHRTAHARLQAMDGSSSAVQTATPRSFCAIAECGLPLPPWSGVWPGVSYHSLHGRWHGARRPQEKGAR
jgi:hypothetical protein